MSVVQIDVWDPTNGPKIFDSLNSRQEPMTIGDLVRNEIFSRVADEHPDVIERVDSDSWQPFYKKFDQGGKNLFDGYFFPYGLIKRPSLKKSEVYASLRKDWDGQKDPQVIIDELAEYQDAFIDIKCGSNISGNDSEFSDALYKLYETGLPSSTYPFLMQLCKAAKVGAVDLTSATAVIKVIESFLVRRAVCGHEPTGLHAVFKKLWSDCSGSISAERVAKEIAKHKTVVWPSNEEVKAAIVSRSLDGAGITRYFILEYDRSLKGDIPRNVPWIEHILPENPDDEWFTVFTAEQHKELKGRLANLIPLSGEMNRSLGNSAYSKKRTRYLEDSMFKSARVFASENDAWNPVALERRSQELADWAVSRWPHSKL
ncbi:MAG: HNH endonuclease family protein [Pseudomonadota bacterium]